LGSEFKVKTTICQVSSCKREGKYLLLWQGQWLELCASHERHFGRKNLEKLGLPMAEIVLLMSEAYWQEATEGKDE